VTSDSSATTHDESQETASAVTQTAASFAGHRVDTMTTAEPDVNATADTNTTYILEGFV